MATGNAGFSVLEIAITMLVVAVLVVLAGAGWSSARKKGALTREIAAGKNLITAYALYENDHNARLMPGVDKTQKEVWFEPYGKYLTMSHVADRYPFRLAPYFDYKLEGTILLDRNAEQIARSYDKGSTMYDYMVAAFPVFGINYYYVGGLVDRLGKVSLPNDATTRRVQSRSSLLVFATASSGPASDENSIVGFNILTPPHLFYSYWSSSTWAKKPDPGLYGNIDARHNGRAVCVFLDGSIQMLTIEELRDMRLWSRNAAELDDPNYQIPDVASNY